MFCEAESYNSKTRTLDIYIALSRVQGNSNTFPQSPYNNPVSKDASKAPSHFSFKIPILILLLLGVNQKHEIFKFLHQFLFPCAKIFSYVFAVLMLFLYELHIKGA